MPVKLICVSHTPMMDFVKLDDEVEADVRNHFSSLAAEVKAYDPELIVLFSPDHFNGFFYDLMPSFCIGLRARSAGDWDSGNDALNIPEGVALDLLQAVQAADVDTAFSYRMQADHGFTQPLNLLTEAISQYPVIPVFINGAARPLPPCRRALKLGEAVGNFLAQRPERVLIIGSGGLSHDPPTPQFGQVTPEVEEFLIAGRNPSVESRSARQQKVIDTGRRLAAGEGGSQRLNPDWDLGLIESFANADLNRFLDMSNEEILEQGGRGGQEIRAWIAAFAALRACGDYRINTRYYRAIEEWIVGMGMVSAETISRAGGVAP